MLIKWMSNCNSHKIKTQVKWTWQLTVLDWTIQGSVMVHTIFSSPWKWLRADSGSLQGHEETDLSLPFQRAKEKTAGSSPTSWKSCYFFDILVLWKLLPWIQCPNPMGHLWLGIFGDVPSLLWYLNLQMQVCTCMHTVCTWSLTKLTGCYFSLPFPCSISFWNLCTFIFLLYVHHLKHSPLGILQHISRVVLLNKIAFIIF